MNKPELTPTRIQIAFAIAIIADLIQIPFTLIEGTGLGLIAGEFMDCVVDCIVAGATVLLLGFNVALLPSLFVEVIPGLDLIPTWTGCVAFVVWQRRKEEGEEHEPAQFQPVVDVESLKIVSEPSVQTLPPSHAPATDDGAFGRGVDKLERLFQSHEITYEQFETRLQKLLRDYIDSD